MFIDKYEEYKDKRKYFRHPVSLVAEMMKDEADSFEVCHILNVSVEGLAFYSQTSFSEGEDLSVKITFDDSSFACRATVIWKLASDGRNEVGLKFLNVDRSAADEMVINGKGRLGVYQSNYLKKSF